MKTLCILRHAKTEVQQQGQQDFDRKLANRGLSDAPEMAKLLKSKKIEPDKIISSPAKRAISTAALFAEKLHYPIPKIEQNSLIYNASVTTLIKIVEGLDENDKIILLVGHNPGFTMLANFYCLPPILHIPTSGIVCINFDVTKWSQVKALSGKQTYFLYP